MVVTELKKTCESCPAQWEGRLVNGRMVYIRYRFGYLSIRISKEQTKNIIDAVKGEEVFGVDYGDDLGGTISFETLKNLTKKVLNFDMVKEIKCNL